MRQSTFAVTATHQVDLIETGRCTTDRICRPASSFTEVHAAGSKSTYIVHDYGPLKVHVQQKLMRRHMALYRNSSVLNKKLYGYNQHPHFIFVVVGEQLLVY